RYSNPAVDASPSAQLFSWETPVPINPFFDGIPWVICSSFLHNFTPSELSTLPIDTTNAAGLNANDKIALLLKILQEKFASDDVKKGSKEWRSVLGSISFLQQKLGLVKEAGESIRTLIAAEQNGPGIALKQALGHQLINEGMYVEAEELMRPACIEVDGPDRAWKYSPQSVGFRRTLLEAIWKQGVGKREDAEDLVEEIKELIEGMRGGEMEVYVDDERETLEKLLGEL
ncbi:hypothetical protein B0T16DRAFT_312337, partial [Cercophora newfieldiana]